MEGMLQHMLQQQLQSQQQLNNLLSVMSSQQGMSPPMMGMSPPMSMSPPMMGMGMAPPMIGGGAGGIFAGTGVGGDTGTAPPQLPRGLAPPVGATGQPAQPATGGPPGQPVAQPGPAGQGNPAGPLPPGQDGRLSTSYRYLGMQWKYNPRCIVPRKLKMQAVVYARPGQWAIIDLATACEDTIDELVYTVTSWRPSIRVKDLGASTKSDLCELVKGDSERIIRTFPTRYEGLAHDLSNVTMHAFKLGLPLEDIAPCRRHFIQGNIPATVQKPADDAGDGDGGAGEGSIVGRRDASALELEEPPPCRARFGSPAPVARSLAMPMRMSFASGALDGNVESGLDGLATTTGIDLEALAKQAMVAANTSAALQRVLDGASVGSVGPALGVGSVGCKQHIPRIEQPAPGSDGKGK